MRYPSMGTLVKLQVSVAQDAAPGEREVRLSTNLGVTNKLAFYVGQLPEVSKPALRVATAIRSDKKPRYGLYDLGQPAPKGPMEVTLPATVNGQMEPGGKDKIKFKAHKGQSLVILAGTRELIPYISDAVPGWFQATLTLYDSKGKEVEYADHFLFNQDPVLHYDVPADDEYTLAIHDSIYRGREDFVYRISMGELPFITSIFPLGGKSGAKTNIELRGWNLPVGGGETGQRARITEKDKSKVTRGVYPISVRSGQTLSNVMPFSVDTLPEATEKEPNNDIKTAQKIKIPVIMNGKVNEPGDVDVFRFDGHAGEEIVAEVIARRLGSPIDSVLRLTDAAGKQLAYNDDFEDRGAGLITHQADSRILYKLPANGTYFVHLGDSQHNGGVEYAYRLRVAHPQRDFELRVVPASINVKAGSTIPITVYALRRDGYEGDITLSLKNPPAGFVLNGPWIPGNQDKVRLTLTVPPNKQGQPIKLIMDGRASVDGKEVHRPGVPAEYMEQAFAYHHLVPAKDWLVRVIGSGSRSNAWKLLADKPVQVPVGGTALVTMVIPMGKYANELRVKLSEPPEGITIQDSTPRPDGIVIRVRADAAKAKPGLRGNLIVDGFLERAVNPGQPKSRSQRMESIGTLPAIPFEVVGTVQARK